MCRTFIISTNLWDKVQSESNVDVMWSTLHYKVHDICLFRVLTWFSFTYLTVAPHVFCSLSRIISADLASLTIITLFLPDHAKTQRAAVCNWPRRPFGSPDCEACAGHSAMLFGECVDAKLMHLASSWFFGSKLPSVAVLTSSWCEIHPFCVAANMDIQAIMHNHHSLLISRLSPIYHLNNRFESSLKGSHWFSRGLEFPSISGAEQRTKQGNPHTDRAQGIFIRREQRE